MVDREFNECIVFGLSRLVSQRLNGLIRVQMRINGNNRDNSGAFHSTSAPFIRIDYRDTDGNLRSFSMQPRGTLGYEFDLDIFSSNYFVLDSSFYFRPADVPKFSNLIKIEYDFNTGDDYIFHIKESRIVTNATEEGFSTQSFGAYFNSRLITAGMVDGENDSATFEFASDINPLTFPIQVISIGGFAPTAGHELPYNITSQSVSRIVEGNFVSEPTINMVIKHRNFPDYVFARIIDGNFTPFQMDSTTGNPDLGNLRQETPDNISIFIERVYYNEGQTMMVCELNRAPPAAPSAARLLAIRYWPENSPNSITQYTFNMPDPDSQYEIPIPVAGTYNFQMSYVNSRSQRFWSRFTLITIDALLEPVIIDTGDPHKEMATANLHILEVTSNSVTVMVRHPFFLSNRVKEIIIGTGSDGTIRTHKEDVNSGIAYEIITLGSLLPNFNYDMNISVNIDDLVGGIINFSVSTIPTLAEEPTPEQLEEYAINQTLVKSLSYSDYNKVRNFDATKRGQVATSIVTNTLSDIFSPYGIDRNEQNNGVGNGHNSRATRYSQDEEIILGDLNEVAFQSIPDINEDNDNIIEVT